MSEESKSETVSPSQRPRSPRVPVNFSVEIEGLDAAGKPFRQSAEAVRVSRGGATLVTDAGVRVGAQVRLTPPFGRALDAEVNGVWMDEADGRQRIGVKLLDQNGWFAE
ncbi:MAG TPA: PilZ domain-containing protein [Pyrinomonadaceae bacterium]|nr:PilZ domain-containing protein [Pyrinomonadaceae bacterium]